jgi:hypothetical protein
MHSKREVDVTCSVPEVPMPWQRGGDGLRVIKSKRLNEVHELAHSDTLMTDTRSMDEQPPWVKSQALTNTIARGHFAVHSTTSHS